MLPQPNPADPFIFTDEELAEILGEPDYPPPSDEAADAQPTQDDDQS